MPRQTLLMWTNTMILLVMCAPGAFADEVEDYAQWWNARVKTKPIPLKDDGTRKGFFGVRFNPQPVSAEDAEKTGLVQGPTFVLGVAIGDEARAWPLHAIGELQNDVVGDVPIAASW